MVTRRYPFAVHSDGEDASVVMNMGGVLRYRSMPPRLLGLMQKAAEQIRTVLDKTSKESNPQEIAAFPDCNVIVSATLGGVCTVTGSLSRNDTDEVEQCIAFYDAEDESAPVLCLVEEQIDEFIGAVHQATKADSTVRGDSPAGAASCEN